MNFQERTQEVETIPPLPPLKKNYHHTPNNEKNLFDPHHPTLKKFFLAAMSSLRSEDVTNSNSSLKECTKLHKRPDSSQGTNSLQELEGPK